MRIAALVVAAAAALTAACDSNTPAGSAASPFAPQPDRSGGLTNVSHDLDAILEHGRLEGACERYEASPDDESMRLKCGKYLFFYGTFGTLGAPQAFVDYLLEWFPDIVGSGFSERGMVPDPYSADGYPLGMHPTLPINGVVPALAFTCASCHFGRLPDGRYAVGYGNHAYDYGRQILELVLFPVAAIKGPFRDFGEQHHPDALKKVAPLLDRYDRNPVMQAELALTVATVLPFALGFELPSYDDEGFYARWKPGVQDFFIPPTAFNDEVHTLHKIHALWGMPDIAETADSGMVHGMLGWAGSVRTLEEFSEQFVMLGGGEPEEWPRERLQPLVDYIHSLRAPENPDPPPASRVARGERLFVQQACIDCHDGPRGSGRRVYDFSEVGTDDSLRLWADGPAGDGQPCCGIEESQEFQLTGGIKSPRLTGLWAMQIFLHNGSVDSLEDLFCLDVERPTIDEPIFSDGGHRFTCDGLNREEKLDLIAFLRTL